MTLEPISLADFEDLVESDDARAVVVVKPESIDLEVDPGLEELLEMAKRLDMTVWLLETPTALGVVHVQPILGKSTMSIPVISEFQGWALPVRILGEAGEVEDCEPVFTKARYEVFQWISGLLVREENWQIGCWFNTEVAPNEYRHLNLVISDDQRGYIVQYVDFLKAHHPTSPVAEVFRFGPGTELEISGVSGRTDWRQLKISDSTSELVLSVRENHVEFVTDCCESLGWDYQEIRRLDLVDLEESGELIADFSGSGKTRTKPFAIPPGCEFFTYSWTSEDEDFDLYLCEVSDPSSWVDYHASEPNGLSNHYEPGKYFFSIEGKGEWRVRVSLDEEASLVVADDPDEVDSLESDFVFWHMKVDDFVLMTPANVNSQFTDVIRNSGGINFIEDLSRGFVSSPDASLRNAISSKHASAISEGVRELDQMYRSFLPPCEVNPATGMMAFVRPIDGSRAQRHFKNLWKVRVSISKALANAGVGGGVYLFAIGRPASASFLIFECSISEVAQQRQATAEAWSGFAEQMERQNAPRRSAQAWFDEGERRGYF